MYPDQDQAKFPRGRRVRLSAAGIKRGLLKRSPEDTRRGTIIGYGKFGTVRVMRDGMKEPSAFHYLDLELIEEEG